MWFLGCAAREDMEKRGLKKGRHYQLIRAVPVNLMAFINNVPTIVTNVLGLLGHRLQLVCKFGLLLEGHLDTELQEEGLLCLEAVEVRTEYRVLLATDQADAMEECIIFVTPGFSVHEITDE
ncbi:hypothetical protein NDU88_002172 [Pleurodeles waltl]|uniref:Uncharacterized protein n=1 Tax=Pleurodeles waltl TaxID=8319 RepID=A0AAV7RBZ6_PLEWA|nr:hypothetical protein NDU88_002172 [Pleurodeles waltl]